MVTTKEEILEVLMNDERDQNDKLLVVRSLKSLFTPPDNSFGRLKLKSLLKSARNSLENRMPEKCFLQGYATSLVNFFGRDATLDSELLHQLEYVLTELKKEDENLTNELVTRLWSRLEREYPDGILDASKQTIERTVLDWVDAPNSPRMEFLSKMAAGSPKLFQTLTSVLFEILARTRGHDRVFQITEFFIEAVKRECQRKEKNFLVLYPKDCRRLVSLLMVPPEVFPLDVRTNIVSCLLEKFLADRRRALILLSHFKEWVGDFKARLERSEIEDCVSHCQPWILINNY